MRTTPKPYVKIRKMTSSYKRLKAIFPKKVLVGFLGEKLAFFRPFWCLIWAKLVLGFGILNFRRHFSDFYVWFWGSPHACYLWVNDHFNIARNDILQMNLYYQGGGRGGGGDEVGLPFHEIFYYCFPILFFSSHLSLKIFIVVRSQSFSHCK